MNGQLEEKNLTSKLLLLLHISLWNMSRGRIFGFSDHCLEFILLWPLNLGDFGRCLLGEKGNKKETIST